MVGLNWMSFLRWLEEVSELEVLGFTEISAHVAGGVEMDVSLSRDEGVALFRFRSSLFPPFRLSIVLTGKQSDLQTYRLIM
jgi:hypothetical protein